MTKSGNLGVVCVCVCMIVRRRERMEEREREKVRGREREEKEREGGREMGERKREEERERERQRRAKREGELKALLSVQGKVTANEVKMMSVWSKRLNNTITTAHPCMYMCTIHSAVVLEYNYTHAQPESCTLAPIMYMHFSGESLAHLTRRFVLLSVSQTVNVEECIRLWYNLECETVHCWCILYAVKVYTFFVLIRGTVSL